MFRTAVVRRLCNLTFASLIVVLLGVVSDLPAAYADCGSRRFKDGVWVECGGGIKPSPPAGGGDPGSPSRGSGERVCINKRTGWSIPCTRGEAVWSDEKNSYCQLAKNQPDKSDPIWGGRTTGAIYTCSASFDGGVVWPVPRDVWMESNEPAPPPDAEAMAYRVVAGMKFEPIQMGIAPVPFTKNPDSLGAVGLPVWLWVAKDPTWLI